MNRTSTLKSRLRLAFLPFFLAVGLLVNQGTAMAQLSRDVVYEYEEYLSGLLGSEDPVEVAKGVRLHELVETLLPTVYYTGGEVKTPLGIDPVIVHVDQISIGMINSSVEGFNKPLIEMAAITLSDPDAYMKSINTLGLSGLENIKYLFFTFTFPLCDPSDQICEIQKVKDLLLGPGNPKLVILYRVSIPM